MELCGDKHIVGDILFSNTLLFFFSFSEKIRPDIKCQGLFSLKNNKINFRMSSVTNFLGALRVIKNQYIDIDELEELNKPFIKCICVMSCQTKRYHLHLKYPNMRTAMSKLTVYAKIKPLNASYVPSYTHFKH